MKGTLDSLEWKNCLIVGHSMGAGLACLFSACFPERVDKLVMIDGFGTLIKPPSMLAKITRNAIEKEEDYFKKQSTSPPRKLYPTIGDAIAARLRTVSTFPGNQSLSTEAAAALISR